MQALLTRCFWRRTGRIAGRLGRMLCIQCLFLIVLEVIRLRPWIVRAVKLDVWNLFRRWTSRIWLSCLCDVTRGCPVLGWSRTFPDCWYHLHNDPMVLRWQPKCLATFVWTVPASKHTNCMISVILRQSWHCSDFGNNETKVFFSGVLCTTF